MKLELKHLSPYLPYGLKVYEGEIGDYNNRIRLMNLGEGRSNHWVGVKAILKSHEPKGFSYYRPILRPLSEFYLNPFHDYPNREMFYADIKNKTISVIIWEDLLKGHFDVFGLIEKGLAVDINTLEK